MCAIYRVTDAPVVLLPACECLYVCVCARDATCSKRECCQRSLGTAAVAVAALSPASSCRVCFLPIASHKIQIHSTLGGTRSTRYFGYYSEYSVLTTPDARTLSRVRSLSLSLSLSWALSLFLAAFTFLGGSHALRPIRAPQFAFRFGLCLVWFAFGSGQTSKNTTKKKNTI